MPIGYFYKWEDNNHGLEHKCGTCKTVLSSPRAKKTCLGVHEEVCTRYHKTLFFPGQSHHCDACHKTDELHDKRHREIIKLLQSIRKHDGLVCKATHTSSRKKRARRPEEQELEEWNDSSTLDGDDADQKLQIRTKFLDTSDNRKAVKAGRKTAKHQAEVKVITENELRELDSALHPDQAFLAEQKRQDASQGLANKAIEINIAFNTHTFKYYSLRTEVQNKKVIQANRLHRGKELPDTIDQKKPLIDPILQRLDLNSDLTRATKDRKTLDSKLREAIYLDMAAVANEETETMQRMAGYWRYANRRTYNAMVRMNEIWDWATGTKLPEIEEKELSDVAESESNGTLAGPTDTPDSASPTTEVESFDGGSDISYSPRRSPGPKLTLTVPSSSSDDFWNGPKVSLEGTGESNSFARSPNQQHFFKPSSIWAAKKVNAAYAGEKHNRFKDEVDRIPSPTKNMSTPKENKKPKRCRSKLLASSFAASEVLVAKDLNNRFKGLKIETAAPKDEVDLDLPKTARSIPTPQNSTSSSLSRDTIVGDDFPTLPSASPTPVKTNVETPKPRVFSIGTTAVKLSDAKSRSSNKKRFPKASGFGLTRTKGFRAEDTTDRAWTMVGSGKHH